MTAISQDFKALGLPRQRPLVLAAESIAFVLVLAAIFAPFMAPYDPSEVSIRSRLQPPSSTFLLGTDPLGRDVLSRIIWSTRIPFYAGLVAVGIGTIAGPLIALVLTSVGGRANSIIQRLMDLVSAFPILILAILLITPLLLSAMAITGPGVVQFTACAGLALATVPMASCYRVARRAISATGSGMPLLRTLSLAVGRSTVLFPLNLALTMLMAMLIESQLTYYGFGVPPPNPSWGDFLSGTIRPYTLTAPWLAWSPRIAMGLVALGFVLASFGLPGMWARWGEGQGREA